MSVDDVPKDRKLRRAFAVSLQRAEIEWDCGKGLHFPAFLMRTWACSQCGASLDIRGRVAELHELHGPLTTEHSTRGRKDA